MSIPRTPTPGDAQSEPDESHPSDDHGVFYWQLPAEQEARLRAENSLVVDEGYLAQDIN